MHPRRALLDEHHVSVNIVSTSACSAGAKILTRLMDWKVRFQPRWRAGFPTQIGASVTLLYGSDIALIHRLHCSQVLTHLGQKSTSLLLELVSLSFAFLSLFFRGCR